MRSRSVQVVCNQGDLIYLISDIHSNLPALHAVFDNIPLGSLVFCSGDVLGYYLDPNRVCELLRSRSVFCVQGNHDKYILGSLEYPENREGKYRIGLNRSELSTENFNWLNSLPDCLSVSVSICDRSESSLVHTSRIYVAHGTPRDTEEYIYPDTSIEFLEDHPPGVLVLGHTHHPMQRRINSLQIVNPGSVGQARDKIPGACFCTLDPMSGDVQFLRVDYDIAAYQALLNDAGVDATMVDILSRKIF